MTILLYVVITGFGLFLGFMFWAGHLASGERFLRNLYLKGHGLIDIPQHVKIRRLEPDRRSVWMAHWTFPSESLKASIGVVYFTTSELWPIIRWRFAVLMLEILRPDTLNELRRST